VVVVMDMGWEDVVSGCWIVFNEWLSMDLQVKLEDSERVVGIKILVLKCE
jgi:hypothetical protein